MGAKLYVGNLSYDTDNAALEAIFQPFGDVTSASVIMDRMTNRSRGFGFVEMASQQDAEAAITGLDGKDSGGRVLKVNVAQAREARGGRRS